MIEGCFPLPTEVGRQTMRGAAEKEADTEGQLPSGQLSTLGLSYNPSIAGGSLMSSIVPPNNASLMHYSNLDAHINIPSSIIAVPPDPPRSQEEDYAPFENPLSGEIVYRDEGNDPPREEILLGSSIPANMDDIIFHIHQSDNDPAGCIFHFLLVFCLLSLSVLFVHFVLFPDYREIVQLQNHLITYRLLLYSIRPSLVRLCLMIVHIFLLIEAAMAKNTLDEDRDLDRTATMRGIGDDKPTAKDGEPGEEEDPRVANISRVAVQTDIADGELQVIMDAALRAYTQYVLVPTTNTWRKEEGSRRELERDVERTAMRDIATSISKEVSSKIGGCWHVVYGHEFATFVTHRKLSFCHFTLEGANVVVWRHGR
eukprot:gene5335-3834_t